MAAHLQVPSQHTATQPYVSPPYTFPVYPNWDPLSAFEAVLTVPSLSIATEDSRFDAQLTVSSAGVADSAANDLVATQQAACAGVSDSSTDSSSYYYYSSYSDSTSVDDELSDEDLQAALCVGEAARLDLALPEADGTCAAYDISVTPDLVVLPGDEVSVQVQLPAATGGAVRLACSCCCSAFCQRLVPVHAACAREDTSLGLCQINVL